MFNFLCISLNWAIERCKWSFLFLEWIYYWHSLSCHCKIVYSWLWKVTWEKRTCILFPLPGSFFQGGYFWPAPDTGNCPVQLKCLQMTLSLAIIHTSLSSWLSLVKYIFQFIGSFLSLLSQGPCCLTTGKEGETDRGRVKERESMMGTMPAVKEWGKLNRSRKGKGKTRLEDPEHSLTVPV